MHDVLGHRLSLLSVHAGALEFRPDAPAEEVARAAKVIRENAESGRAGMLVALHQEVDGAAPDLAGRTAYRVVREGLTNARKHAPGAEVRVWVTGSPDTGLTVEVGNTAPPAASPPSAGPPTDPGAGQGLAGLAERVGLASGRLEHGPTPDGGWCLSAWLPWPP